MELKLHKDFVAGRYQRALEALEKGQAAAQAGNFVSLIGALSLTGRIAEADAYFRSHGRKQSGLPLVAARFFLATGWARQSEYVRSRELFEENARVAADEPLSQFFVHQGDAFYYFYTGRTRTALAAAEAARAAAIAAKNLFARSLATDGLGLCHVSAGEIHHGLSLLSEAQKLAEKLGNVSFANSSAITQELFRAEFGLDGEKALARLEKRLDSLGTEDSYSASNVALELARQYTLRGRYRDSARVLESAAPRIYSNKNRRHEIQLNLRLAELAGRRGEFFLARHYLWFARRFLHAEADGSFALSALGIERKLAQAEGQAELVADCDRRWEDFAEFSATRDLNLKVRSGKTSPDRENPEDLVHAALWQSREAKEIEEKLRPLLERGYHAEVSLTLQMAPGVRSLALVPGGIFHQDADLAQFRPARLSPLQRKLLTALAREGEVNKEKLVQAVWKYSYHPLRHDSMLYAALSGLRKVLGPVVGSWILASENGYRLDARFVASPRQKSVTPAPSWNEPAAEEGLNHRQIEILEWLRKVRFVSVGECRERFGVSEITALRDLADLTRRNFVLRIGKARATRYTLRSPTGGKS